LGKFKQAAKLLEKYTRHHQKDYLPYAHLGYAHFKTEMYDLALDAYLKAEKLNPINQEIKESINLCREKFSFH
jgi:tetratricopeptide (TPR) repeat protein